MATRTFKYEKMLNREKKMVSYMIEIYCKNHHKTGTDLCPDCTNKGACLLTSYKLPISREEIRMWQVRFEMLFCVFKGKSRANYEFCGSKNGSAASGSCVASPAGWAEGAGEIPCLRRERG